MVCVRWSARAAPRLGDLVAASAGAHLTLDAVSGAHLAVLWGRWRRPQPAPAPALGACLCQRGCCPLEQAGAPPAYPNPPYPILPHPSLPAEFHFSDSGHVMKHTVDCTSYSGMQLAPALARLQRSQPALVPGMAGGSFDEC